MGHNLDHQQKIFNKMEDNSVLFCNSCDLIIASADETFPFVVNKNFFYLTGIEQEQSHLILIKEKGAYHIYLFIDEYNYDKEKWFGRNITFEYAKEVSEINDVISNKEFENKIKDILTNPQIKKVYFDDQLSLCDQKFKELLKKYTTLELTNSHNMFLDCRLYKDDYEISQLQKAILMTKKGIDFLLTKVRPGEIEHLLSDTFEYYGKCFNRHSLAFSTICASGKNATILHYPITEQDDELKDGDLILFDLGFKHNQYNADVSRTYPINGKFDDLQRKIYEAVLYCNKECIKLCRPGITPRKLQEFAVKCLEEQCKKYNLIEGKEKIDDFYYHSIGHSLGLDTHDGRYVDVPLQKGAVITIEPGLYFRKYNIGVRIEDDVLFTDDEPIVLTAEIEKEIDEIEAIMAKRKF